MFRLCEGRLRQCLLEAANLSGSPWLLPVKRLETEDLLASDNARIDVSKLIETRTVLTEGTLERS